MIQMCKDVYSVVKQTCFGCRFRCKVGSEALQQLGNLLFHKEADEGGGRVELQRDRHRDASLPLGHGGLESIGQGLHLSISTLTKQRNNLSNVKYIKHTNFSEYQVSVVYVHLTASRGRF